MFHPVGAAGKEQVIFPFLFKDGDQHRGPLQAIVLNAGLFPAGQYFLDLLFHFHAKIHRRGRRERGEETNSKHCQVQRFSRLKMWLTSYKIPSFIRQAQERLPRMGNGFFSRGLGGFFLDSFSSSSKPWRFGFSLPKQGSS
jgi:uncharacterized membrane protein YciS (DUF1049 family)